MMCARPPNGFQAIHALVDKGVINWFLYEPARGIAADLARVEGDCVNEFLGGLGDVHIVKHHSCTLAAQFELDGDEVASAVFSNEAAYLG